MTGRALAEPHPAEPSRRASGAPVDASRQSSGSSAPGPLDARRKRIFDLVAASTLLATLAPLMAALAAAIAIDDGRPVLYRQRRVGALGKEFTLLKFRTMIRAASSADPTDQVALDDPRVTRIGRPLRRLHLDELPQLLNVVRGELSLVGPRPALPTHVASYDELQRRRLLARPGITGWAQVNGNTALPWSTRIVLDVWYIDHWSLRLDVLIFLTTSLAILRGERPNARSVAKAFEHAQRTSRRG